MQYSIKNDDVLEWARNYDGPQFHAILCDPPYELDFMGKTWDNSGVAFNSETWALLAQHLLPGGFGMAFAGSRGWHRLAVAIEDAGLIIHPSIFGWGFGSGFPKATRIDSQIDKAATVDCPDCVGKLNEVYKQIAISQLDDISDLQIEHIWNAEKRPELWTDEQKQMVSDTENCNRCNDSGKVSAYDVREVVGERLDFVSKHRAETVRGKSNQRIFNEKHDPGRGGYTNPHLVGKIIKPTTPLAQAFEGHRYGRQALKPALEPIIVFQKPYTGRAVDCITETGAGALNIDGGRIGTDDDLARLNNTDSVSYGGGSIGKGANNAALSGDKGRWPANLTLTHSPDCVKHATTKLVDVTEEQEIPWTYEDFFENYDNIPDDFTDEQVRELYKATPKFWHKTVKVGEREEVTERWQCTEQCPVRRLGEQSGVSVSTKGHRDPNGTMGYHGGVSGTNYRLDGHSDQGTAARYFFNADWSLDVAEQLANADPVRYQAKASRAERDAGLEGFEVKDTNKWNGGGIGERRRQSKVGFSRNPHPTVKPIKLIEHLATLLLPPERYAPNRRLLVPFSGSGSEMIGAILAGWDYIQGIDLTSEYVEIAHSRIKYWSVGQAKSIDNEAPKPKTPTIKPGGQITLF